MAYLHQKSGWGSLYRCTLNKTGRLRSIFSGQPTDKGRPKLEVFWGNLFFPVKSASRGFEVQGRIRGPFLLYVF